MSEKHNRMRRGFFQFVIASNQDDNRQTVNGNNNIVGFPSDRNNSHVGSHGLITANKVMKDASDLIGVPARILNSIQEHWLISLVCMTIILVCILAIYCIIQYHGTCGRKNLPKRSLPSRSRNRKEETHAMYENDDW